MDEKKISITESIYKSVPKEKISDPIADSIKRGMTEKTAKEKSEKDSIGDLSDNPIAASIVPTKRKGAIDVGEMLKVTPDSSKVSDYNHLESLYKTITNESKEQNNVNKEEKVVENDYDYGIGW